MNQKNSIQKKKQTSTILLTALLLGLIMPLGIYYSLQNGWMVTAEICFSFLAVAMALIAWKG